jgi:hypothetical protein
MLWKEVKTWATSHGYKVDRTQAKDKENSYNYTWESPSCSGSATSTFDLAKDIYNNITQDQHVEHQKNYQKDCVVNNAIH